jgi:hypothetical protein
MSTDVISPLRRRMIEDMSARKLGPHTQRSHIGGCKRFAAYLKRSPDTAAADDRRAGEAFGQLVLLRLQVAKAGHEGAADSRHPRWR